MKLQAIWYQPQADVEFTWADVECLILLSETHYDHRCRELSRQGGTLYGMRNRFNFPLNLGTEDDKAIRRTAKIALLLDTETLDLLAKCAERDPSMYNRLAPIVKKLNATWRKINKENLRCRR